MLSGHGHVKKWAKPAPCFNETKCLNQPTKNNSQVLLLMCYHVLALEEQNEEEKNCVPLFVMKGTQWETKENKHSQQWNWKTQKSKQRDTPPSLAILFFGFVAFCAVRPSFFALYCCYFFVYDFAIVDRDLQQINSADKECSVAFFGVVSKCAIPPVRCNFGPKSACTTKGFWAAEKIRNCQGEAQFQLDFIASLQLQQDT